MKIQELYESVTKRIIDDLQAGTTPWEKPWADGNSAAMGSLPFNAVTRRHYSGINVILLWERAIHQGYLSQGWITFKQAQDAGGHVRKGEKGTRVVFTKFIEKEDEDGNLVKRAFLRSYIVFNVGQISNLPKSIDPFDERQPEHSPDEGMAAVDQFITAIGAEIVHGGDRAYFAPQHDRIVVPPTTQFETVGDYYATVLHELVHWTGHKQRLDRLVSGKFGDKEYGREELVAELGAAFLCCHLGIPYQTQHASYLSSWLSILKEDNRAIFKAASYASQASTFLIDRAQLNTGSEAA